MLEAILVPCARKKDLWFSACKSKQSDLQCPVLSKNSQLSEFKVPVGLIAGGKECQLDYRVSGTDCQGKVIPVGLPGGQRLPGERNPR